MDLPKKIKRFTQGLGVDATIDTTASGRAIKLGLESLRKLGKLILIGASEEIIPGITSTMMLVNEFEILGSRSSTKQELIEAVSIAASSKIKSIVTETYRIEEINEALEKLKNGGILGRAVVIF